MKKVAIFDYWGYYSPHLEVMAAIARREVENGADVRYFACDGGLLACEVDPWGNKVACSNCRKRGAWASKTVDVQQTFIPLPPASDYSVDTSQLEVLESYHYHGINIGIGCASSYISRTRDQNLTLNRITRPVLGRQLTSAKMVVDAVSNIFSKETPDVVYLFNGRGFINRAIIGTCNAKGIPYVTVEVGANDERVEEYLLSLPHSILARTKMMQDLWISAEPYERENVARSFFEKKRNGGVTNDKSYVKNQVPGKLPELPHGKTIIAIFNSSDDEIKSIGDEWSMSSEINQYEVVENLVERLAGEDVYFLLRMHPNLASVKAPWVKEWERIRKYKNCFFIDAKSKISSYEILDVADKVLVFGSTIGPEAVVAGKPVILYGNAYYEHLNITYRANSLSEVANLCMQPLAPRDPEPALMYAYFLMRSGKDLLGYKGHKLNRIYSLMGDSVPFSPFNGLRGKGSISYMSNWLMNRFSEWLIRNSLK